MPPTKSELAMRTLTPEQVLIIDHLAHRLTVEDRRPYTLERLDDDLLPTPTSEAAGELVRLELIGYEADEKGRKTLVAFADAVAKADRDRKRAVADLRSRIAKADVAEERTRLAEMSKAIENPPERPSRDELPRRGGDDGARPRRRREEGDGADDGADFTPTPTPAPAPRRTSMREAGARASKTAKAPARTPAGRTASTTTPTTTTTDAPNAPKRRR